MSALLLWICTASVISMAFAFQYIPYIPCRRRFSSSRSFELESKSLKLGKKIDYQLKLRIFVVLNSASDSSLSSVPENDNHDESSIIIENPSIATDEVSRSLALIKQAVRDKAPRRILNLLQFDGTFDSPKNLTATEQSEVQLDQTSKIAVSAV